MTYYDCFNHAYHRRFIAVCDMDDGDMLADEIFEDYHTAVGYVMAHIWEFAESYQDEGDEFEISLPDYRDYGEYITIKFQSHNWEKPSKETWMILYCDERTPELDKPKEKKSKD